MSSTLDPIFEEILSVVKETNAAVARLERKMQAQAAQGSDVASDAELDGDRGDPAVRKDPPRWEGQSYAGCNFSTCEPAYLDMLAGFLDWQAERDEKKTDDEKAQKYARYKRMDARRARGWSRRLRSGWKPAGIAAVQRAFGGQTGFADTTEDPPF